MKMHGIHSNTLSEELDYLQLNTMIVLLEECRARERLARLFEQQKEEMRSLKESQECILL